MMKAFPLSNMTGLNQQGMDLRDYFAAKALPVLLNADTHRWGDYHALHAEEAYKFADAMMKARNAETKED
jgi:hypothetical protein